MNPDINNQNKADKILIIFIILIFLTLIFLVLILNKDNKKELNKITTTTTYKKEDTSKYELSEEQKNNINTITNEDGTTDLYVNGVKLDLNVNGSYYDFKQVNNQILFNTDDIDTSTLYSIDTNAGNLINLTEELKGSYYGEYDIKNDVIYITTNNLGQDSEATVCNMKDNEKAVMITKAKYKNGEYVISLDSYKTAKEYINDNYIYCK